MDIQDIHGDSQDTPTAQHSIVAKTQSPSEPTRKRFGIRIVFFSFFFFAFFFFHFSFLLLYRIEFSVHLITKGIHAPK